jgi:hypothetical protein
MPNEQIEAELNKLVKDYERVCDKLTVRIERAESALAASQAEARELREALAWLMGYVGAPPIANGKTGQEHAMWRRCKELLG